MSDFFLTNTSRSSYKIKVSEFNNLKVQTSVNLKVSGGGDCDAVVTPWLAMAGAGPHQSREVTVQCKSAQSPTPNT